MDRYVVREPRAGANYPQGNQMMAYSTNAGRNNIMSSDNVYYTGPCANQAPNIQQGSSSNYMGDMQMNQSFYGQTMMPAQGQVVTGIDPRYLTNYCDNNAQFIVTGQQQMHREPNTVPDSPITSFGANYQNNNFIGVDRNRANIFAPKVLTNTPGNNTMYLDMSNDKSGIDTKQKFSFQNKQPIQRDRVQQSPGHGVASSPVSNKKSSETESMKKEPQIFIMSRADKLKALHKSGPRAFSGPVEKVLKWHKALQDIGVFVFYEIVAKCVSVRPGESCAKNLVVRDDNGPAMQVVYYEIDFLLPEIKIPSTIRVVGRMIAGTCRLQAFNVRPATGDDVATLPRRAAVAAHHVAKLCKEYGVNQ